MSEPIIKRDNVESPQLQLTGSILSIIGGNSVVLPLTSGGGTGTVISDVTGIPGASSITNIVVLTQASYDALATIDPNTAYLISDNTVNNDYVISDISGLTGAQKVENIVIITQAGYDAIAAPLPETLYVISTGGNLGGVAQNAAQVPVADVVGNFVGTDVEGVLAEIASRLENENKIKYQYKPAAFTYTAEDVEASTPLSDKGKKSLVAVTNGTSVPGTLPDAVVGLGDTIQAEVTGSGSELVTTIEAGSSRLFITGNGTTGTVWTIANGARCSMTRQANNYRVGCGSVSTIVIPPSSIWPQEAFNASTGLSFNGGSGVSGGVGTVIGLGSSTNSANWGIYADNILTIGTTYNVSCLVTRVAGTGNADFGNGTTIVNSANSIFGTASTVVFSFTATSTNFNISADAGTNVQIDNLIIT